MPQLHWEAQYGKLPFDQFALSKWDCSRPTTEDKKQWNSLDRQALEEQLVTVLWLDCHGECVWWDRINAEDMLSFTGYLASRLGVDGDGVEGR